MTSSARADNINNDIVVSGVNGGDRPSPWEVDSIRLGSNAGASGSLTITDGGTVTTPSYGYIGDAAGSTGSVSVTGPDSAWHSGTINVGLGADSTGSLTITDQGTVTSTGVVVGIGKGSTGTVDVTGPGTSLAVDGVLWVGFNGDGTVNVENGGSVSSSSATVGLGSTGTVNVSGPDSTLNIAGKLSVASGTDSQGNLYIRDGGKVDANEIRIGNNVDTANQGAVGSVLVDGAGSQLTSTNMLQVGGSGVGRMTVSDGGLVNSGNGSISSSGSEGSFVHVTGNGSAWNNNNLTVGDYSDDHPTSNLMVDQGGKVVTGDTGTVYAAGAATISGAGSAWEINGELQSNGSIVVADGGRISSNVKADGAYADNRIGTGILSAGTRPPSVLVTGSGSSLNFDHGDLYIAEGMAGSLVVEAGGEVNVSANATSHIGSAHAKYGDSIGQVLVEGAGSTWRSGNLELGRGAQDMFDEDITHSGHGSLSIVDGGTVHSSSVALGTGPGNSSGTVYVSGASSLLDNAGTLHVGQEGTGDFTIMEEGHVRSSGDVVLAQAAGSTGTLNIGSGNKAGTLDATRVQGGEGVATINFNHTDATDFDAQMNGNLTVNKVNTGTVRLLGQSNYTGTTTVNGGTLQAGAAGVFSGNSGYKTGPAATLDMGGFDQKIASLENAGVVAFAGNMNPSARSAPMAGATLTVSGDYVGNGGALLMNTALGSDDSVTDRLVVGGNTSGETFVQVKNAGGAGAATDNGIELISVAGVSNGTFALQGRAVAGLYDYQLYQGGKTTPDDGNWYLRSEADPKNPGTPEVPGMPEIPGTPGQPGKPTLRPEPGAYLGNQNAALRMFQHTMHDRVGEPGLTARKDDGDGYATWMRVQTSKLNSGKTGGQIDVDTNTTVMQLGAEKQFDAGTGRLHAGVMGGYGRATTDAKSNITGHKARGIVDGKNIGIYGTWFQNPSSPEGAYVDTWLQYGDFDNTVKGDHLGSEKYKSRTWSGSLEAGYAFKVHQGERYGVYLEPQAQVIHTDYRSDDVREENGTRVQSGKAGGTTTRLGARVYARSSDTSSNRIQPFAEVNWWSGGNKSSIAMDGERLSHDLPKNILETKVGAQFEIGRGWSGYGSVGYQQGSNSFSDVSGQAGVKFSW
ncbi:autotransporter outer membrane beta-barrel domain-containing protein [Achromobacter seleniivolatilans]|uniref:Autotransporter outer membrane beta-barrel domain-containing protein n=1 Tax=Achromobacter seleniivolatilans TaxID=3047478 RepID=A0ABY9M7I2_9BURK|nr:autotransporter outer membrane beta-barrel domain-containing protein [Achromobacter sp. R39]WMD22946.1 autotransporter outer membrane beta-barrel domain-containing protein [Achromobacter sp. R39]